jgi:hypothetical protein
VSHEICVHICSRGCPGRVDRRWAGRSGLRPYKGAFARVCPRAGGIERDEGGLRSNERNVAEILGTIAHAGSQQPRKREQHGNANEYVGKNFCFHKERTFLSLSPAEVILGLEDPEGGEEPSRGKSSA